MGGDKGQGHGAVLVKPNDKLVSSAVLVVPNDKFQVSSAVMVKPNDKLVSSAVLVEPNDKYQVSTHSTVLLHPWFPARYWRTQVINIRFRVHPNDKFVASAVLGHSSDKFQVSRLLIRLRFHMTLTSMTKKEGIS